MTTVLASNVLANGLRTEFADTYIKTRQTLANSRLGQVMDLNVGATNRQHEFAYFESAPHMEYWQRGDTVPTKAFDSVQWTVPVYEFARRIPWSKFDRKDDQTQSLMDAARQAGASAGLLPERIFFNLITGNTDTLPAVPNAPDGAAMFSSATRFGAASGNLLTATAGNTAATILADYYAAMEQFRLFQDGEGQPLLGEDVLAFTCEATGNLLTAKNHSYVDDDEVFIFEIPGETLPTGLARGLYFVITPSGDDFTVESTLGGGAVSISADGAGYIAKVVKKTLDEGDAFTFEIGDLDIYED